MSETAVVVLVALFTSITAPIILSFLTDRRHERDKQMDYEREDAKEARLKAQADEVAATAAAAAERVAAKQDEQAAATRAVANQAAVAADLLVAANERVAQAAADTSTKLDSIHTLVNSNMTAAMEKALSATMRELVMMREVIAVNRSVGREPSQEALDQITATEIEIVEMENVLADRKSATATAAAEVAGLTTVTTTTTTTNAGPDEKG